MRQCSGCGEEFEQREMTPGDLCAGCDLKDKFAKFAMSCDLTAYPDPSGERYLYDAEDGRCWKKNEMIEFMDALWNALALANGRKDLLIGGG